MRTTSTAGFDIREAIEEFRERFAPDAGRDNVRSAILVALRVEPMNGYQLIGALGSRPGAPAAGAVYPTLQLLTDEGLVSSEQIGERRVYSLTDAGVAAAAQVHSDRPASGRSWEADRAALPKAGMKLAQAIGQVATSGTREQSDRAAELLDETRRKLYAILAED